MFCLNLLPPADVNSWLVTFGFQLYNVIPGYHKPNTEAMEPSYELVRTQVKTQEWDSTKVILTSLLLPSPPVQPDYQAGMFPAEPGSQRTCQLSGQTWPTEPGICPLTLNLGE